jgi:hypothetical protein
MRSSRIKFERYHQLYMDLWNAGKVAVPKSHWHRDNQMAYTLFLANNHNSEIKIDRARNEGKLNARFEPAEELCGTEAEMEVRGDLFDEADDYEYPSAPYFLRTDVYEEIREQQPPSLEDLDVAFPQQSLFQRLQEMSSVNEGCRFMARPARPSVCFDRLTEVQKWFINLAVEGKHQVLYLMGEFTECKCDAATDPQYSRVHD